MKNEEEHKSPIDKIVEISIELSNGLENHDLIRSKLTTAIANLDVTEIDKLYKAMKLDEK
tara:strand:- start:13881 stop:14060 length:180 start_codon:yes stop_codon:yes gene_type:complete